HGRAPEEHRTREREREQQQVAPGPEPALLREAEPGLEQDRIAEQPEHAPQVAGRVEEVGIARRGVPRGGEPLLEERARRRDHEEGEPAGDRAQREQPPAPARRPPPPPARRTPAPHPHPPAPPAPHPAPRPAP